MSLPPSLPNPALYLPVCLTVSPSSTLQFVCRVSHALDVVFPSPFLPTFGVTHHQLSTLEAWRPTPISRRRRSVVILGKGDSPGMSFPVAPGPSIQRLALLDRGKNPQASCSNSVATSDVTLNKINISARTSILECLASASLPQNCEVCFHPRHMFFFSYQVMLITAGLFTNLRPTVEYT